MTTQAFEWLLNHASILIGTTLGVWVLSLLTVIFSTKFRRKLWWGLCCFVSLGWKLETADMVALVGLPIGAVFVLAVAMFGPTPTPKEQAATANEPKDTVDGWW
ncbi:MAG: hypothetical protein K9G59_01875 [Caulobacter sp.]|nr:hypothetical protein [Caulobacter sp.]